MTTEELLIRCRIEELPFVTGFIHRSLQRDQAILAKIFPGYTPDYVTNFGKEIADLNTLINPYQYTAAISLITEKIVIANTAIDNRLPILKRYVEKAVGTLDTAPSGFYLSKLGTALRTGDRESAASTLKDTLDTINYGGNLAALKAQGYTPDLHKELEQYRTTIADNILARKAKIDERAILTQSNNAVMNKIWLKINEISKDAKSVFAKTDKSKAEDYNITKLISSIRKDQKKTEINGKVTLPGNATPTKATIILTPVDGGRNIKIKPQANGTYSRIGLAPNTYIATAQAKGYGITAPQTLTIESNQPLTANFTLAPSPI